MRLPCSRIVRTFCALLLAGCGASDHQPQLEADSGGAGSDGGKAGSDGGKYGNAQTCANERYVILDEGSGACSADSGTGVDGSGLVKDTSTGLIWARNAQWAPGGMTQAQAQSYCTNKGMRLPTESEAFGIAGNNYNACAFPCSWVTWTSTKASDGTAWAVGFDSAEHECPTDERVSHVMCVR